MGFPRGLTETAEDNFFNDAVPGEKPGDRGDGDLGGQRGRNPVNTGTDGGKGDAMETVFPGQQQRPPVTSGK